MEQVHAFIPLQNMDNFNRTVAKMQSLAAKLHLEPWVIEPGEKEWRTATVYFDEGKPEKRLIEGYPVAITGESPVIAGWRFLAKIEHDPDGNLVKRLCDGTNGTDISPELWHECEPNCEHCGVSRQRKITYMIEKDGLATNENRLKVGLASDKNRLKDGLATNENRIIKQVGSSCLSDFLGKSDRDPARILSLFEMLMEIRRDYDYDEERCVSPMMTSAIAPERLMAAVFKAADEDGGYLSAEKAGEMRCLSTADRLKAAFWSMKPVHIDPSESHIENAQKAIEWLKAQRDSDSLWLRNIAILAGRGGIGSKDAGLFASGYVAWNRNLQKRLRAEAGHGEWIGEAAGKISIKATFDRRSGYDSAYGYVNILSFCDEAGNALTWKTSSPPCGLILGETYTLAATVKAHGEYKGEKQTEIIRVKAAELELFSFGALAGYKKIASVARPDAMDEQRITPLTKAIWDDRVDHARILIDAGADVNRLNQNEVPMLAYAQSVEMAELLIDRGADVNLDDDYLAELSDEVSALIKSKSNDSSQDDAIEAAKPKMRI